MKRLRQFVRQLVVHSPYNYNRDHKSLKLAFVNMIFFLIGKPKILRYYKKFTRHLYKVCYSLLEARGS
jgi:hypothetical protein